MIVALLNRKSDVGNTTLALDPAGGWPRQRLRVVVFDADRKGGNENCWLDWSEQRAKEGFTELLEVIGLTSGAPRRDALEIACMVGHVVTDGPPRFAVRTRSALLAADVAVTPLQPSPSGERALVKIRKLLEKARIFRPDLHPRFIVNCYGPRALIVLERLAKQDTPRRAAASASACRSRMLRAAVRSPGSPLETVTPHGQIIVLAAEIISVAP